MPGRSFQIDRTLERAATGWKWLQILTLSSEMAAAIWFGILLVGFAMSLLWVPSGTVGAIFIGVIVIVGGLTWFVRCILAMDREPPARWLAGSIEQAHSPLLDRLNTLVELQDQVVSRDYGALHSELVAQTGSILDNSEHRNPFPWSRSLARILFALLMFTGTIAYYIYFEPFEKLRAASAAASVPESEPVTLEIPPVPEGPPAEHLLADKLDPWGEIRISQPGVNLRITRFEDVPLVIEAAASQPMTRIDWFTSVNNADEQLHELPPSEDPRYAVHKPIILPSELHLKLWDILQYRAVATCENDVRLESLTYFIEIVPSREEIEQIPDKALESLEQLTGLVERQQQVIRETELLAELSDPQTTNKSDLLAGEEQSLSAAAEILESLLHEQLANSDRKNSQKLSATLDLAADELNSARNQLREGDLQAARFPEFKALEHLASARRSLSELVLKHPELFTSTAGETLSRLLEEPSALESVDDELAELLKQTQQEYRQLESARELVEQLATQQTDLAERAADATSREWNRIADDQQRIRDEFQELTRASPEPFRDLRPSVSGSQNALQESATSLRDKTQDAAVDATRAGDALHELADQLNKKAQQLDLTKQQTLQHRLQKNIDEYSNVIDRPEPFDLEQRERITATTKSLLDELKDLAKQQTQEKQRQKEHRNGSDSNTEESPDTPRKPTALDQNPKPPTDSPTEPKQDSDRTPTSLNETLTKELENQIRQECQGLCQNSGANGTKAGAQRLKASMQSLSQALGQDLRREASQLTQQQITDELRTRSAQQRQLTSARDMVQQTLEQERSLQNAASRSPLKADQVEKLREQQEQLTESLQEFRRENPDAFTETQPELDAAANAMHRAEQSLQSQTGSAAPNLKRAAENLQQLDSALERQQRRDHLHDQQQLRQAIDESIEQLEEFESNPSEVTQQQKKAAARQSQAIASQGQQEGDAQSRSTSPSEAHDTTETSSNPLQQATTDEQLDQLNSQAQELAESEGNKQTRQASRALKESLQSIADAFDQTMPEMKPGKPSARQNGDQPGSLRPRGREAIQRGLRQLESAARENQAEQPSPQNSERLRADAQSSLSAGISSEYGSNPRTEVVLRQVREELQEQTTPIDAATLERMHQAIKKLQAEGQLSSELNLKPGDSRQVDVSRYPPEYRESIRRYFEALSEQK